MIIPEQTQGVQAWDRYAYTNNNPILHTDPTGHCTDFISCIVPDAFVISIGYNLSWATDNFGAIDLNFPESIPVMNERANAINAAIVSLMDNYDVGSIDLVIIPGEDQGDGLFITESLPPYEKSGDDVNHNGIAGDDYDYDSNGWVSPQASLTITGATLWDTTGGSNSFINNGVDAYSGESIQSSSAFFPIGIIGAENYVGISGGLDLGIATNVLTWMKQNSIRRTDWEANIMDKVR